MGDVFRREDPVCEGCKRRDGTHYACMGRPDMHTMHLCDHCNPLHEGEVRPCDRDPSENIALLRSLLAAERQEVALKQAALNATSSRAHTLRTALRTIQQWDAINPPPNDGSDLRWLRALVDTALGATE